jgi:small conductance mechanosensitive channel
LFFRPFKIGDVIQVGGAIYIVDSLGFFICKGHLADGPSVFIPNSQIWGQTIINLSVTDQDIRRIDESYGISYSDNIDLALAILHQIVLDEPRILKDPAPLIKVASLGDNAVNIMFRVWTARSDNWNTKLDLVQRCKEALEAGGCTFPFPQTDTHVYHQTGSAPVLSKKD